MKYYLVLIIILSKCACAKKRSAGALDNVKWDFYKKNQRRCFIETDRSILYLQSNLVLHELEEIEQNLRCFFGVFSYGTMSSQYLRSVKEGCGMPLVSKICYSKTTGELIKEYNDVVVFERDEQVEKNQNQTLKSTIKNHYNAVHKDLFELYKNR